MSKATPQDTFREEARELLELLDSSILSLEDHPDSTEAIDQVFRSAHTLKGSGAMAGFDSVAGMAHELESAFDLVRAGRLVVSPELISLTLWVSDLIKKAINGEDVAAQVGSQRVHAMIATLKKIAQVDQPPAAGVAPPAPTPAGEKSGVYLVRFYPSDDTLQRGIQPENLLASVAELGKTLFVPRLDRLPLLQELDAERCYFGWDILLCTEQTEEEIRDLFIFVEDGSLIEIQPVPGLTRFTSEQIPLLQQLLQSDEARPLTELVGKLAATAPATVEAKPAPAAAHPAPVAPHVGAPKAQTEGGEAAPPEATGDDRVTFLRVRTDRLDTLVNLVGELVVLQGRLLETSNRIKDPLLTGISEETERLMIALRRTVLQTRMLQIGTIFSRYRRLVRDLAQELNKDVELVTSGEKTELDKNMLDQLQDPLVHLVRNCVDHGTESPEARRAAGKDPHARIQLAAMQRGASIVIQVSDDGAGLNLQRIKQKALDLGLIEPNADMSDQALAELIFHPGLSTAAALTNLSGRGVGMDAVREAVDALRGTIEVETWPGRGTTFTIKLPLTMAILDGLLVQAGPVRYVIPLADIKECIELRRSDVERANGRRLVMLRGDLIPYLRLREEFRLAGEPPAIEQVVIVQHGSRRTGLVVDRVIGGHQSVIKSLGQFGSNIPGISGATILGDGGVALTLDMVKLIALAREQEKERLSGKTTRPGESDEGEH